MAGVGCVSGVHADDKAKEERSNVNIVHPLHDPGVAYILPTPATFSNPHDIDGWEYNILAGGAWIDAWKSVAGANKVWYYFAIRRRRPGDEDVDEYELFFPHYNCNASPTNGRLALRVQEVDRDSWQFKIYEWQNGVIWGLVASGGSFDSSTDHPSPNLVYYITLEVDVTNETVSLWAGDASAMMNSGNPYIDAVSTVHTPVITGTPSVYHIFTVGGKATKYSWCDIYEVFVNDDTGSNDTTRKVYYGASSQCHVFTAMPNDDVAGGAWSVTGNVASCSTHKWRAVDDPFDDEDQTDDYISVAGDGTNKDQLFEITNDYHEDGETPAIMGTHVIAAAHDIQTHPTHCLAKVLGETATSVSGTATISESARYWMYGDFLDVTPDGNAWTPTRLDALRAGVRNDHASETRYAYQLLVQVVGTYLQQPANNEACPGFAHSHVAMTT